MFPALDFIGAHFLLQLENKACTDGFDDRRCAALFPPLVVLDETMVLRCHIHHRTATDHRRHTVIEHLLFHHQHPRRTRAADKLVGGDKHRVQRCIALHIDTNIGRRSSVVPERKSAMALE